MSEAQKSVMGPKRLFILLALGAVVFMYLSDKKDVTDSEVDDSKNKEMLDKDIDLNSPTVGVEIYDKPTGTKTKKTQKKESGGTDYGDGKDLNYDPADRNKDEYDPKKGQELD